MKKMILGAAIACAFGLAQADLPTAATIQKSMGMGYNIGNTMEATGSPTLWGNIYPTQAYLDSIKAAGFSTVRIPCAWNSHANGTTINTTWLDSVQTVVNYAMNAGLYTILNIHWDGGWLQDDDFTSAKSDIVAKQKAFWTQIANKFKNYNERLLFAGMNEPGLNLTWSSSLISALVTYQQTFIDAVRATGGNNATRALIVQGPKTDIDVTNSYYTTMPTDNVSGHMMVEIHYYDPYQYTLMTEEQNWGASENILPQYYYGDYLSSSEPKRNAGYNAWALSVDSKLASITHANEQFAKMKTQFIDKGYPVIIGEFGANLHTDVLSGSALTQHKNGRIQWHKDVATAAKNYGLTPILWDMGNESSTLDNMCYIRHSTSNASTAGKVVDVDVINALRGVYGLGTYKNTGVTHVSDYITGGTTSSSSSSTVASSSSSQTVIASSSSNSTAQAATITKTGAGSSIQSVAAGSAITAFGYTIKNATSATITGLPDGVTYTVTNDTTVSVSGTVSSTAAAGKYSFTLTVYGTDGAAVTKGGSITVTNSAVAASSSSAVSSSSVEESCDALAPECGWTVEALCEMGLTQYCDEAGIITTLEHAATLTREGNFLLAQGTSAAIRLFDMNGNLVRSASSAAGNAQMSLSGLRQGMYIAKFGGHTLKVDLK